MADFHASSSRRPSMTGAFSKKGILMAPAFSAGSTGEAFRPGDASLVFLSCSVPGEGLGDWPSATSSVDRRAQMAKATFIAMFLDSAIALLLDSAPAG